MNLENLLKNITYIKIYNKQNIEITGIAYNSKNCKDNYIFVAITGLQLDGKNYISNAISNGANVIVCDSLLNEKLQDNITYIIVEDARATLAKLAHTYYNFPSKELCIIGITGTNGKTTITFLIKSILEAANEKVTIIGTTGIYIDKKKIEATHTTPESLELAQILRETTNNGIKYVVMEVSSHSIAMQRINEIDFKLALFTNLTHEHLDFHKDMHHYGMTKYKLFQNLKPDAIAISNKDENWGKIMIDEGVIAQKRNVGFDDNSNYVIDKYNLEKDGSRIQLHYRSLKDIEHKNIEVKTLLPGLFNVQNAALAVVATIELGIPQDKIKIGLANCNGAPGRMQIVKVITGATAYVDYAHTPDALEKVLQTCKTLMKSSTKETPKGKLICIFGCGGDRDKTKRQIMGKIATKYADIAIITDDNPRTEKSETIIKDILAGIENTNNVKVISNRSEAIKSAVLQSNENDIILVAGKGHEDYQIIGTEKHYFSDVNELLKQNNVHN